MLEIPRADLPGEDHRVADTEFSDCVRGSDGMKQLATRMYRVGDRDQMLIELASSDLFKQLAFGGA